MNLQKRREKDRWIRSHIWEMDTTEKLTQFVLDIHSRFYSPKMPLRDVWLWIAKNCYGFRFEEWQRKAENNLWRIQSERRKAQRDEKRETWAEMELTG